MTKEDDENFGSSKIFWICDDTFVKSDAKVRDHCHVTGKYWGTAYKDCNIIVNLNYKNSTVLHNLKCTSYYARTLQI